MAKKTVRRGCAFIIILAALLLSVGIVAAVRFIGPLFAEGANVLILFNNTDEMRGTGGFTTAYMTITRHRGDFVTHLGSSFEIDTPPGDNGAVLVVPPPRPMHDYMDIDRWSFRDANWSPDYPTSAQATSKFYTQITQSAPPLYIITVNMSALQTLMQHLPPVTLACDQECQTPPIPPNTLRCEEGCQRPPILSSGTILDWLRAGWTEDASGAGGDKSFIGDKARQMIAGIRALPLFDQMGVIAAVGDMLARGDVLLYSSDPQLQAFFAARGWSGPFPLPTEGNVVFYNENNIGYNKTSSSLTRDFLYQVDFTQSPPIATLTITYHNEKTDSLDEARLSQCHSVDSVGALALGVPEYKDRMVGCAWIYGQIYPMAGAKLTAYDVPSIPADQFPFGLRGQTGRIDALQDGGAKGSGYVMVIPYGESRTVTLTYTLPVSLSEEDMLTLPAIAGMRGLWHITVHRRDGSIRHSTYDLSLRASIGSYTTP